MYFSISISTRPLMNACFRYRTIISLLPLFQRNNTFQCIRAQKSTHTRELDVDSNVSLLCFSTPRAAHSTSLNTTAFLQRRQQALTFSY